MSSTPSGGARRRPYQADAGELDAWAEVLDRAAATAARAASEDGAYDELAAAFDATRDDIADIRDTVAGSGAVTGDDLSAVEGRIDALVEACERV